MKKISVKNIIGQFAEGLRRFPLSFVFFFAFAMLAIAVDKGDFEARQAFFLLGWTATAAFINVLITLGFEAYGYKREKCNVEYDSQVKKHSVFRVLIILMINVVWLGICLLYRSKYPLEDNISWAVSFGAVCASVFISVFLLPFFTCRRPGKYSDSRELADTDDLDFWNYTVDTVFAIIVAGLAGFVLYGGIAGLLLVFETLFDVNIKSSIYFHIFLVCITFIAPAICLQFLPQGKKVHSGNVDRPAKAGLGLLNYLFIPLLCAYFLTLYVYAAKILIEFELPCGWVSVPLTISFAGMLLVTFLLYPVQFRSAGRFDKKVLRYLPIAFLPLLLLMTVGIVRRFSDYGITIQRLYLLIFNIWCYFVCIGLIISRSRKVWWIPVSFVLILLVTSVGPQNISALTRRSLAKDVEKMFASGPDVKFPLDSALYRNFLESADTATALAVDNKLEYMLNIYREDAVRQFVDSTAVNEIGKYDLSLRTDTEDAFSYWSCPEEFTLDIPEGYTRMKRIWEYDMKCDTVADTIKAVSQNDSLHVSIPFDLVSRLKALGYSDEQPEKIDCEEGILWISRLVIDNNRQVWDLCGYLFLE